MEPIFLLSEGEVPEQLGRGTSIIKNGKIIEIVRALLKMGGGAESRKETWTLIHFAKPEEAEVEQLAEAVRENTRDGGEFSIRLDELQLSVSALSAIAKASETEVWLVAVFKGDEPTWQD